MANLFITEYEIYKEWHPAEGGCILEGRKVVKSYEEADTSRALSRLLSIFYSACDWFGEGIKFDKIKTEETVWGFTKSYVDKEIGVHILLVYDKYGYLCSNYVERDDGSISEDYSSFVLIHDNGLDYHSEIYPETRMGLHTQYAEYC